MSATTTPAPVAKTSHLWQAWCEFGNQEEDERFLFRTSIPIMRSLTLDARFDDSPFGIAQQLCDDPSGIVGDGEREAIQLNQSQLLDRLHLSVNAPVWGVRYGVHLPIRRHSGGPQYDPPQWHPSVLSHFEEEFRVLASDHKIQITLLIVEKGTAANERYH
jgi:hypothetical protein